MKNYNPKQIEGKWQEKWEKEKIFQAKDFSKNPKFFILDMFPYPSGEGLHVGHPRGYIGTDIISHYMRMTGYNVLHPMGWDAFGLPAENYAIKTGTQPAVSIKKNIKRFKEQMKIIGLSYDWSKEVNTTDPEYYKWTQWIFLRLFEKGLAYQSYLPINWCPSCKTGLANEEVVEGKCERCGVIVTKKNIRQWVLKITDYAEELLDGLDKLDWPEKIKEMQKNWIGKSQGADIIFPISNSDLEIKVFTTRPDTIFGVTFIVLAPEHKLVEKITVSERLEQIRQYQKETKEKLDVDRQIEGKGKTGVFTGTYAFNPATRGKVPIYIADYVLPHYGYGATMGVPSHDSRDYEFAKKFRLPIKKVIKPVLLQYFVRNPKDIAAGASTSLKIESDCWEGEGILINSEQFNGMDSEKSREKITKWLEERGCGKRAVHYKLRDWIFSRQRYWGEPIPLIFCENCKNKIEKGKNEKREFNKGELLNPGWIVLSDKELPLKLPKLEKYQPTNTGESPLAQVKGWRETICPKCGEKAKRETNTMPQWAGSCWYFIRYLDSGNKEKLVGEKLAEYWLPVDFYVGGAEHAVLHLLYSRFWIKVLFDLKIIDFNEPFLKLQTIGLILASNGQKMSKSRGNVINPDQIIKDYGADAFRLYEMFIGPFDQPILWDSKGILGTRRFLEKIWNIFLTLNQREDKIIKKKLHQLIKKITKDIEAQKFNTAIAAMMGFVNEAQGYGLSQKQAEKFLKILAPFAPHITEELWRKLGHESSVLREKWPKYDKRLIKEEAFCLLIQVNGKLRDTISAPLDISEKQAKDLALKSPKIKKWLDGKKIKKMIFLKDKLINFVI